jgi:serine/threonine protein kinase
MNKTRKVKKTKLYLKYLKKQRGGKIPNLTTFQTVCSPESAHANLIALKSIKSPEESDDFIQVVLSKMKSSDQPLIVKIQEPGKFLTNELKIQKLLKDQNNVIQYICDFPCLFNKMKWNSKIEKPTSFCDDSGESMHIIVMEYINNDLANLFETIDLPEEVFKSIIKQVGFSLLEIHLNHNIAHNDLNRGNLLVNIGTPKDITYIIDDFSTTINTFGYEFILIDFQRGNIISVDSSNNNNLISFNNSSSSSNILFQLALDEISLAFELVSKWIKTNERKIFLRSLVESIMNCKSLPELISIINL